MTIQLLQPWNGNAPAIYTTFTAAEEASLIAKGLARLYPVANAASPVVRTGSYVGTGNLRRVACGMRPDVVFVVADDSQYMIWRHQGTYRGRAVRMGSKGGHSSGGIIELTDDGFQVTSAAQSNTNATTYHWVAIADNGSGRLVMGGHIGNGAVRDFSSLIEETPVFFMAGRDNTYSRWFRAAGQSNAYAMDAAASSATMISSLSPVTISAAADLNELTEYPGTPGAEGVDWIAFLDCPAWSVLQYTGDGTASDYVVRLPGWSAEEYGAMAIIKGHNDSTPTAAQIVVPAKSSTRALPADGTSWTSTAVSAWNGPLLKVSGTGGANYLKVNEAGTVYTVFAIKASPLTQSVSQLPSRTYVGRPALRCETGGGIITQVTENVFNIEANANSVRPITVEWFGIYDARAAESPLWAFSQTPAVCALRLFGATGSWDTTNDLTELRLVRYSGSEVEDNFGRRPARGALVHLVLRSNGTHDSSTYRLTMNGRYHVEVKRNHGIGQTATTKLAFMCHRNTSDAIADSSVGMAMALCRLWDRELTNSEVAARAQICFGAQDVADVSDFFEEWDAANYGAGVLPATRNIENRGVVTNCTQIYV